MRINRSVRALKRQCSKLWSDLEEAAARLPQIVDRQIVYPDRTGDAKIVKEPNWSRVLEELDSVARSRAEWEKDVERGHRQGDDFDNIEDPSDPAKWDQDYYLMLNLAELTTQFVKDTESRDLDKLRETWTDVEYCAEQGYYGEDMLPKSLRTSIGDLLESLSDYQPKQLYVAAHPVTVAKGQPLILSLSQELAHRVLRDPGVLYSVSPRVFEELVADVWAMFGYRVELTALTHDGGRDIIAVRSEHGILEKLLIECKRYSKQRKVGVSEVRALYGVKALERATKALLATTTFFTRSAREFEQQVVYELELKDYNAVIQWVEEYRRLMKNLRA